MKSFASLYRRLPVLHILHDDGIPFFWTGISAETHLFLEHAFCEHDLHASSAPLHTVTTPLLLTCVTLLLTLH